MSDIPEAREAAIELSRQLGGLREWTATELQMVTRIIEGCFAQALQKQCESLQLELQDARSAVFRCNVLEKQCEELRAMKAHHDYCRALLNCPDDDVLGEAILGIETKCGEIRRTCEQLKKERDDLRSATEAMANTMRDLRTRAEKAEHDLGIVRGVLKEECESEQNIRNIIKPLGIETEHDGYAVICLETLAEQLVARVQKAEAEVARLKGAS